MITIQFLGFMHVIIILTTFTGGGVSPSPLPKRSPDMGVKPGFKTPYVCIEVATVALEMQYMGAFPLAWDTTVLIFNYNAWPVFSQEIHYSTNT